MKKISTVGAKQSRNFSQPKLTIGLWAIARTGTACWTKPARLCWAETGHDPESDEGRILHRHLRRERRDGTDNPSVSGSLKLCARMFR